MLGGSLGINLNPKLSSCDAQALVSQLRASGWTGTATVSNNNPNSVCN